MAKSPSRRATKRAISSRKRAVTKNLRTRRADLKPWAAYILGYNSFMVRVWQIVFWEHAEPHWEADDGVPLTLDEISQAAVHLAREANAGVKAKLTEVLDDLAALNESWKNAFYGPDEDGVPVGAATIPGADLWQNLRFLADDTLDEDSRLLDWYGLGTAFGRYQLELEERDKRARLPDLRPIFDRAAAIVAKGIKEIPELVALAKFSSASKKVSPSKILERFCDVGRQNPRPTSAAGWASLVLPRIVAFNGRIQEGLCRLQQEAPKGRALVLRGKTKRPASATPERTTSCNPFVPTPLQQSILNALDGKALKKQCLADAICAGEASRLYRPGGIKELKDIGKVQHKYGVGYYRPDAPPPNALDLDVN